MTAMDIDPPASSAFASSVVYSASNNSGLHVALHPLTLLNISDQYTRTKAQQNAGHSSTNNNSPYVIGALLGTQTGRDVDITNSYELLHTVDPETGKIIIDATYFVTKQEQFRQVFPLYDFLGWYSTGTSPTSKEIDIHKQMLLWNESPLYLQLDPSGISASSKSLPVTVYESIVDLVGGQALTMFVKTKYKIHTGEAERIAVEHVAHATAEGDGEASSLIPHLTSQRNAIKMLHTRIQLLHEYLQDVNAGTVPKNHTILRQIASLCNRMPAACATTEFREEFLTEYNDVLLASYLATVTRGTNDMNELVDKLNVVHGGAHNRRRGMFAA